MHLALAHTSKFSVRGSGRTAHEEAFDREWKGDLCVLGRRFFSGKLGAPLEPGLWAGGGAQQMLFVIGVCGLVVLNTRTSILLELSFEFSSRETFVECLLSKGVLGGSHVKSPRLDDIAGIALPLRISCADTPRIFSN